MNTKTLVLISSVLLAITPQTLLSGKSMEEAIPIPLKKQGQSNSIGRPHAPALPLFSAELNNNIEVLSIISVYEVGEVLATIENLSTGEYYEYSFDSSEIAVLPISCTEGFWRITLSIESGDTFVGEFEI